MFELFRRVELAMIDELGYLSILTLVLFQKFAPVGGDRVFEFDSVAFWMTCALQELTEVDELLVGLFLGLVRLLDDEAIERAFFGFLKLL